jgi:hypothetical protein
MSSPSPDPRRRHRCKRPSAQPQGRRFPQLEGHSLTLFFAVLIQLEVPAPADGVRPESDLECIGISAITEKTVLILPIQHARH